MPKPTHTQDQSKSHNKTELFTIRMWREVLNEHYEWRGKVLHSGRHKEQYFREWDALTEFIKEMLLEEAVVVGKDVSGK